MKTFYNRSLNWINYLLGSLLGLLGFSCDGIGETPDEYGTPWATYQFKGRALDASNQPINNLRVKAIPSNSDLDIDEIRRRTATWISMRSGIPPGPTQRATSRSR